MFGLGAGWANVPALHLLLGVPLKGAVATSNIVMSIVNTSAAWIYIERGAMIPMVAVPSVIGSCWARGSVRGCCTGCTRQSCTGS